MAKAIKRYLLDAYDGEGTLWNCDTPNFNLRLILSRQWGFEYDGEDEDGETQRQLDNGTLVAFDSELRITLRQGEGVIVGRAYLGSSVYQSGNIAPFLKDGYFRDMLREASEEARAAIEAMRNELPVMRSV